MEEKEWTPGQAFRFCRQMVSARQRGLFNDSFFFPVFPRPGLLPGALRPHYDSIRAFSIVAEDFTDDPQYLENLRPVFLENWESQLLQCTWRKPNNPVFVALKETIEAFNLPVSLFQDILTARKLDLVNRRFSSFDDLLVYTRFSSRPFGRLGLLLLGKDDPELERLSDLLSTGIQLACFWKNIGEDLRAGRVTLPADLMKQFHCSEKDFGEKGTITGFGPLVQELVLRTREFFIQARPLPHRLAGRLRFEVSRVILSGERILDRIDSRREDRLHKRLNLGRADDLLISLRALTGPRPRQSPEGGAGP
ncbi:MAG TPA: squalene/phytoene synthase family protein [Nitrospiria bacterium]|nr:squalene/phytoene synthase family protein [Nitrospiria bacterium]